MLKSIFGKKEEGKEKIITNNVNFDQLVEKVKKMPVQEGQILLWKETFGLEKWHFITKPIIEPNDVRPFIGEVEGKGWIYLFTDGRHAQRFGEGHALINNDGVVNTIVMEPKMAVEWLIKWTEVGVFGLRFNEGQYGWFAPIANLKPMMDYLHI